MTEQQAADPQDQDIEDQYIEDQDIEPDHADQDEDGDEVNQKATTLRERGAVARPQAEDPAAVEPKEATDR